MTEMMWDEADAIEVEAAQRRLALAMAAAEPLWEFLSAALSPEEYEGRKALVAASLDEAGPDRAAVVADLDARFADLHAQRQSRQVRQALVDAQARRVAAALKQAADDGQKCPSCGQYEAHWTPTGKKDADGEDEHVLYCSNCDYNVGKVEGHEARKTASKSLHCDACGHEWTTDAEYALKCPECGAEESVRYAAKVAFDPGTQQSVDTGTGSGPIEYECSACHQHWRSKQPGIKCPECGHEGGHQIVGWKTAFSHGDEVEVWNQDTTETAVVDEVLDDGMVVVRYHHGDVTETVPASRLTKASRKTAARTCDTVSGCTNPATHYVMGPYPGDWAVHACDDHLDTAKSMWSGALVEKISAKTSGLEWSATEQGGGQQAENETHSVIVSPQEGTFRWHIYVKNWRGNVMMPIVNGSAPTEDEAKSAAERYLKVSAKVADVGASTDAGSGHVWLPDNSLQCPSSDKAAGVRATGQGLQCQICGAGINRAELHDLDSAYYSVLGYPRVAALRKAADQEVYKANSSDQQNVTNDDLLDASLLQSINRKPVRVVFFNDHGVAADHDSGHFNVSNFASDGSVDVEWYSDNAGYAMPIDISDIARVTRVPEAIPAGQDTLFAASRTAANPNFRTPEGCMCPPPRVEDPRGDRRKRKHWEIRDDSSFHSGPYDRHHGGPGSASWAMMQLGETIGFGSTPNGPGLHIVEVEPGSPGGYDSFWDQHVPAKEPYTRMAAAHEHDWEHREDGPDNEWWECSACHVIQPIESEPGEWVQPDGWTESLGSKRAVTIRDFACANCGNVWMDDPQMVEDCPSCGSAEVNQTDLGAFGSLDEDARELLEAEAALEAADGDIFKAAAFFPHQHSHEDMRPDRSDTGIEYVDRVQRHRQEAEGEQQMADIKQNYFDQHPEERAKHEVYSKSAVWTHENRGHAYEHGYNVGRREALGQHVDVDENGSSNYPVDWMEGYRLAKDSPPDLLADNGHVLNGPEYDLHVPWYLSTKQASGGWLDAARKVVAESQHAEVDGMILDLYTASMLVQVHDALSPENQTKFAAMPLEKAQSMALRLTSTAATPTAEPVTCPSCGGVPVRGDWDRVECDRCGSGFSPLNVDIRWLGLASDEVVRLDGNGILRKTKYAKTSSLPGSDFNGFEMGTGKKCPGSGKEVDDTGQIICPECLQPVWTKDGKIPEHRQSKQGLWQRVKRSALRMLGEGDHTVAPGEAGSSHPDNLQGGEQRSDADYMRTPRTTRPRVTPAARPEVPYPDVTNVTVNPDQTHTFSPVHQIGQEFTLPTFEQIVSAKVNRIARRVQADNPHLSDEQANELAARAVASYPEMVSDQR